MRLSSRNRYAGIIVSIILLHVNGTASTQETSSLYELPLPLTVNDTSHKPLYTLDTPFSVQLQMELHQSEAGERVDEKTFPPVSVERWAKEFASAMANDDKDTEEIRALFWSKSTVTLEPFRNMMKPFLVKHPNIFPVMRYDIGDKHLVALATGKKGERFFPVIVMRENQAWAANLSAMFSKPCQILMVATNHYLTQRRFVHRDSAENIVTVDVLPDEEADWTGICRLRFELETFRVPFLHDNPDETEEALKRVPKKYAGTVAHFVKVYESLKAENFEQFVSGFNKPSQARILRMEEKTKELPGVGKGYSYEKYARRPRTLLGASGNEVVTFLFYTTAKPGPDARIVFEIVRHTEDGYEIINHSRSAAVDSCLEKLSREGKLTPLFFDAPPVAPSP